MKILKDYERRAIRLTAVVKLADNGAFVLTAYLVRKPVGGRQLWPKRN
jgi:hypothetical protein